MVTEIPLIKIKDLSKRFNREWIFRNLTYQFNRGSIYVFTGPNGSGKSTLLQVITGAIPPTDGSLTYYNVNNSEIAIDNIYKKIAVATPYMDLIEEFTLDEHLSFHFGMRNIRYELTLAELKNIMYLENAGSKHIQNFSSGMKQRLKLGLAFYTEADIVFLDEPGTNLDQTAFNWYYNQLLKVPKECTVIIASNNPQEYPENSKRIDILSYK
ncbi:ABC transporter ATP-binding protein [Chryseosolibacter indicus]|uniref:ATP-binding cassette domain-containing protein n=1 Tax=Chryseosolibacter indicus TaxID=2782351 RepID=A0ABS5VNN2_9BACT|nr:ATP-binding cassette domain-containing protein [Chryseosolibacter indicus]MBT1702449.1 ATP-binding cassette domain-containing protein [Chryseosolibacter indicus]